MKAVIARIFAATLLLVSGGSTWAQAQDVTISFRGTLTQADETPFPDIAIGTPFTGSYTFNLSTPDNNSFPEVGNYSHTTAPYGITVTIGSHTFKTDPSNVDFGIEVDDNYPSRDAYFVYSYNNVPTDGRPVEMISWMVDDSTQTALSSPALPATAPDLS
jgi:hypothetical protein